MNLNVEGWKQFKISELFDIYTGGDLIMSSIEEGDIPIASNSIENNNIAAFTSKIDGRKLFDHTKSISIADRGCFRAFIQPKDFYIATRVKALVCKEQLILSINQLAFIASIINLESFKFSYGRNCCANLPNMIIKLPTISSNDTYSIKDIDLEYIEQYIKTLHYKPITSINNSNQNHFDARKWKYFRIKDLFNVILSKGDIKIDEVEKGDIPLISSGETDNGLIGYISKDGDGIAEINKGNVITLDMFCNAFYQNRDFYAVSHGRVNILVPKFEMNKYIGIFIATIINQEKFKYSYGRGMYSTEAAELRIMLPINTNKHLDLEFMERYIKNLPYGDRI